MQRIINDPNQVVEDMLKGFVQCHTDLVSPTDNPRVLKYKKAPVAGKVGIVTGAGESIHGTRGMASRLGARGPCVDRAR